MPAQNPPKIDQKALVCVLTAAHFTIWASRRQTMASHFRTRARLGLAPSHGCAAVGECRAAPRELAALRAATAAVTMRSASRLTPRIIVEEKECRKCWPT